MLPRGLRQEPYFLRSILRRASSTRSLLLLPLVGFLPADDPRIQGTLAAIEKYLLKDGFVARYNTEFAVDGLPGNEGAFLACSFWLADNYILQGRHDDARALFERLLDLRNDVVLLAEEYDPKARRQVGNYPQAFSHVALINTAHNLTRAYGPAQHRAESKETAESEQQTATASPVAGPPRSF